MWKVLISSPNGAAQFGEHAMEADAPELGRPDRA
jgi:hypothetical protein